MGHMPNLQNAGQDTEASRSLHCTPLPLAECHSLCAANHVARWSVPDCRRLMAYQ